jgi:hypothetical protein
MYPFQVVSIDPNASAEIATCCSDIIHVAQNIVSRETFELRYIIFPLFIAGFASNNVQEKSLASDLLRTLEGYSYGGNTRVIRRFLGELYEKQGWQSRGSMGMLPVDWVEEMKARELHLVIFGL